MTLLPQLLCSCNACSMTASHVADCPTTTCCLRGQSWTAAPCAAQKLPEAAQVLGLKLGLGSRVHHLRAVVSWHKGVAAQHVPHGPVPIVQRERLASPQATCSLEVDCSASRDRSSQASMAGGVIGMCSAYAGVHIWRWCNFRHREAMAWCAAPAESKYASICDEGAVMSELACGHHRFCMRMRLT